MKNKVLEDIKEYAVRRLNEEYGYAGLATGDHFSMINSGNTTDVVITIKEKVDENP